MAKTFSSLLVLSAIVVSTSRTAWCQQAGGPPLVNVTGEAEIRVAPDVVVITFGVEARATGLDDAITAHSEKISKLIKLFWKVLPNRYPPIQNLKRRIVYRQ